MKCPVDLESAGRFLLFDCFINLIEKLNDKRKIKAIKMKLFVIEWVECGLFKKVSMKTCTNKFDNSFRVIFRIQQKPIWLDV